MPSLRDTNSTTPPSEGHTLDPKVAQQAIAMAYDWALRAPHVTDIWVVLACPPAVAYRIYGEVLAWHEIPSWLIPGATERAAGLIRRLTPLIHGNAAVVHSFPPGEVNVAPLEGNFEHLLRHLRKRDAGFAPIATNEPDAASGPTLPENTPPRNEAFFPVFPALADGIAQAAWEWASTDIDTVWVCLTDVSGTPRSTVLFGVDGGVQAAEEVGGDMNELESATLMEWRDFVSAGPVGVHHPGMVVIRRERRSCEVVHADWGTVGEDDVERWVAGVKASALTRDAPLTPPGELPQPEPSSPSLTRLSPPLPSAPRCPTPARAPCPLHPPTPIAHPPSSTALGPLVRAPLPSASQQAAFLARFQTPLASTLRAVLAWPLDRCSVSTMWVHLAHLDGVSYACVLMDDGKGSGLAALGGCDPAPLLEKIGGAWASMCSAGEAGVTHPMGVLLIVRPNAGPSLTLETSWEREGVDWPEVAPGSIWRRAVMR